jgi:hypothetical protein
MKFGTFHTLPPHMNYLEMVKGAAKSIFNSMNIWPAFARELRAIIDLPTDRVKAWQIDYSKFRNRVAEWDVWNSRPVRLISAGIAELNRKLPGGLREIWSDSPCFSRYGDFGSDGPSYSWPKCNFGL